MLYVRFVYEENQHDGFWLRLGISKLDNLREKRTQLLKLINLPDHGEFWIKKSPEPVDADLLAFLRIFNMDEGNPYITNPSIRVLITSFYRTTSLLARK